MYIIKKSPFHLYHIGNDYSDDLVYQIALQLVQDDFGKWLINCSNGEELWTASFTRRVYILKYIFINVNVYTLLMNGDEMMDITWYIHNDLAPKYGWKFRSTSLFRGESQLTRMIFGMLFPWRPMYDGHICSWYGLMSEELLLHHIRFRYTVILRKGKLKGFLVDPLSTLVNWLHFSWTIRT